MDSNAMTDGTTSAPAAGLTGWTAHVRSASTAPKTREQGTGLPFAGSSVIGTGGYVAAAPAAAAPAAAAQVAVLGARVLDLPGLPPRGAPV